ATNLLSLFPHFFFLLIRPLPRSTLFPYTTLFRSCVTPNSAACLIELMVSLPALARPMILALEACACSRNDEKSVPGNGWRTINRSEEHTSELQSRGHLVCRLLLEKKKNTSTRRLV